MGTTVTLVIHGTFAGQAAWWRLGNDGQESFADRLERELSRRGLADTVWKRALAEGFDYASFAWSGRNRHGDRVAGAHRLGANLNALAQSVKATPSDPLLVNVVAHSHGGNVVLEALRHLQSNVRVDRMVLLGTPLITVRPAFRAARFLFSAFLLSLVAIGLLIIVAELGSYAATGRSIYDHIGEPGQKWVVPAFMPAIVLYAAIFWLTGNALDVVWRLVCRILEPLAWLRGKSRLLVYGPSKGTLKTVLRKPPILLLTTHNDEADVLLHVGSAPARLYRDYVRTRFSRPSRLLEFLFLRSLVVGVFLKAVEMLLEVLSLGFSVWRTLVQDFEVASPDERSYYPASLLVQERLDIRPNVAALAVAVTAGAGQRDDKVQGSTLVPRTLDLSLEEITTELIRQVRLRHSAYYDNEEVVARVADFLTRGEVTETKTVQSLSISPSPEFWEVLLMANIGLGLLCVLIAGRTPLTDFSALIMSTMLVAAAAYVPPFALFGIGRVYRAARRREPPGLQPRFWILWAICALMTLGASVALRNIPG
jgi:hypothetical protein